MKVLFMGLGSIGKRNLESCARVRPDARFAVLRRKDSAPFTAPPGLKIETLLDPKEARAFSPDIAWICTPTSLHADSLAMLFPIETAIFLEKPLGGSENELSAIEEMMNASRKPFFYGCLLRLHPLVKRVKELIETNTLGAPVHYRIECGSDLRTWRPDSDYRKNYSAKHGTGGGVSLDLIHEWDLALHWFGVLSKVSGFRAKVSPLEIESDDLCIGAVKHESGPAGQIFLTYYQSTPTRKFQIECEKGRIEGDLLTGALRAAGKDESHAISRDALHDLQSEQIFRTIEEGSPSPWNLSEALALNRKILSLEFLR